MMLETEKKEKGAEAEPQASMERLDLGSGGGRDDEVNAATASTGAPTTTREEDGVVANSTEGVEGAMSGAVAQAATSASANDNGNDTDTTEIMDVDKKDRKANNAAKKKKENSNDSSDDSDDLSLSSASSTASSIAGTDKDDKNKDTVSDALAKAMNCKEEGNTKFQSDQWDVAARSYRQGLSHLKKHVGSCPEDETLTTQVEACYTALQTNLSTVLYKQGKFRPSCNMASKLLERQPTHVKALYRRALAQRKLGNWDDARSDLKKALQVEPNNTACKKELASLKKDADDAKQKQKSALARAFSNKSSSLLYDDKEAALKRKQQKEAEEKKKEQELYKKRKQEWEDECVKRMAKNEAAISFDEWDKEQKEIEKAQKEEEEKARKAKEKERKEALRRQRQENKLSGDGSDSEDDDVLTEKELAMMRGYKKTKDGRITSYFTRELSEEERARQQALDTAPKRLTDLSSSSINSASLTNGVAHSPPKRLDSDDNNGSTAELTTADPSIPRSLSATSSSSDAMKGRSAWNLAGTWEEKDTTTWCTERLRKRLEGSSYHSLASENGYDVVVTEVDKLEGHASVATTAGKKRYIFEYEAKIKYEIQSAKASNDNDAATAVVATGTAELPDISSIHIDDDLEINFRAWKKRPKSDTEAKAVKARSDFVDHLRREVKGWVQEFNEQY